MTEEKYYAVIDVEALVLVVPGRSPLYIVEQVAMVMYSPSTGREVWSERTFVKQPHTNQQLAKIYGVDQTVVDYAIECYERITGDAYLHPSGESYSSLRNRIVYLYQNHILKFYGKGVTLENSLFSRYFPVYDLASFGCPKYPFAIHNPLEECRFFSKWIPELHSQKN